MEEAASLMNNPPVSKKTLQVLCNNMLQNQVSQKRYLDFQDLSYFKGFIELKKQIKLDSSPKKLKNRTKKAQRQTPGLQST